jgi:hypothetical protein
MMEFRHCINILMRHTRDLTDEQWNILDPLRRAAGGDVGTTAWNRALPSSVAMEAMIFTGGEIGDICPWQTKKIGQYTVQKEWSTKPGRS